MWKVAKGYSGYIIVDVLRTGRGRGGEGVWGGEKLGVESVWPAWSQGAQSAKESNQREPPNEAFQEKACLQQRPRPPPRKKERNNGPSLSFIKTNQPTQKKEKDIIP